MDIIKWLVSYSWNQGVQLVKQMDEQDARNWLNLAMSILRKSKDQSMMRMQYFEEQEEVDEEMVLVRSKWESLLSFLTLIARKMEESHQKVIMHTFPPAYQY